MILVSPPPRVLFRKIVLNGLDALLILLRRSLTALALNHPLCSFLKGTEQCSSVDSGTGHASVDALLGSGFEGADNLCITVQKDNNNNLCFDNKRSFLLHDPSLPQPRKRSPIPTALRSRFQPQGPNISLEANIFVLGLKFQL